MPFTESGRPVNIPASVSPSALSDPRPRLRTTRPSMVAAQSARGRLLVLDVGDGRREAVSAGDIVHLRPAGTE